MSDLTIVVPSRGRPDNIHRLIKAFYGTTVLDTRLVVVVDQDDPSEGLYEDVCEATCGLGFVSFPFAATELKGLNPILNHFARAEALYSGYIGFMGDDHLPRTHGWDERLITALGGKSYPRKCGVAYANDLFQGQSLPTAVVMDSDIVCALGYMSPPPLKHMYMDNFWKRLGEDLGSLQYLDDVIIEHLHPFAGKAASDEGYQRVNAQEVYDHDSAAYHEFLENQWPADLTRLRMVIDV